MSYGVNPCHDGVGDGVIEAYRLLSTSALGHLTHTGYLPGLRALHSDTHLCGRALTAEIDSRDSRVLREALIMARPGDVLVIVDHDAVSGCEPCLACWGELRTLAACVKGLAGVVVIGAITDVQALRALSLPIFHRDISALTIPAGESRWGELNRPVSHAGVGIAPGDLIFGDDDGLFALSPARATSLLSAIQEKEAADARRRDELLARLGDSRLGSSGARE